MLLIFHLRWCLGIHNVGKFNSSTQYCHPKVASWPRLFMKHLAISFGSPCFRVRHSKIFERMMEFRDHRNESYPKWELFLVAPHWMLWLWGRPHHQFLKSFMFTWVSQTARKPPLTLGPKSSSVSCTVRIKELVQRTRWKGKESYPTINFAAKKTARSHKLAIVSTSLVWLSWPQKVSWYLIPIEASSRIS